MSAPDLIQRLEALASLLRVELATTPSAAATADEAAAELSRLRAEVERLQTAVAVATETGAQWGADLAALRATRDHDLLRALDAEAAIAELRAEVAGMRAIGAPAMRQGCNYVSPRGRICNKCGHDHGAAPVPAAGAAPTVKDSLTDAGAAMREALLLAQRLCNEALPKFNWGASALDANAIKLLNDAPLKINAALAGAQQPTTGGDHA